MLQKRRLLRKLRPLITHIRPNREPVLHITIQADLVRNIVLLEDVFRLSTLLRWENLVCFGSRDTQRRTHGLDFIRVHERRMSHAADIDAFALCREASDVFGAEAVADAADLLAAVF